MNAEKNV